MTNGRVNPAQELAHQGITGLGNVYYNYLEPALVEEAVKRGEGRIGKGGAFLCSTGQFTGRSPKDKFVVRTASVETPSGGKTTRRWRRMPLTGCTRTCWSI